MTTGDITFKIKGVDEAFDFLERCESEVSLCGTAWGFYDKEIVHAANVREINLYFTLFNRVKYYDFRRAGGPILAQPGDFAFVHISRKPDEFHHEWRDFLCSKLQEKGLRMTKRENDLCVVNDKDPEHPFKVMGFMSKTLKNKKFYSAMHLSLTADCRRIAAVCKKKVQKIPCGLNAFGISGEDVERWFKEFLETKKEP